MFGFQLGGIINYGSFYSIKKKLLIIFLLYVKQKKSTHYIPIPDFIVIIVDNISLNYWLGLEPLV